MEDYQISKNIIPLYYFKLLASSMDMITQFLKLTIKEITILLCQNMVQNIEKFLLRYK